MAFYHRFPIASDTYNKSELRQLARESGRSVANLNAMKGYQLGDHVDRIQRGLRLYYDHTLEDLAAECAARDIPPPPAGPTKITKANQKANLIASLDRADESREFHGFLELPPELRQRIYVYAFSYPDNAHYRQQPAISRTSHQIRKESLPVFYETNRFGFLVDRTGGAYSLHQYVLEHWPVFTAPAYVAMIRHFELTLLGHDTRCRVKIDLPSDDGKRGLVIQVWSLFPEVRMTREMMEKCQASVERLMRPRIEVLLKEVGLGKFGTREVMQIALSVPKPILMSSGRVSIL